VVAGNEDEGATDVHVTSSPVIWYAARASGVAAYVVLTLVVSLGLGLGGKVQTRRWPRFSVEDIHRFGGLLVGSLIGVHVLTIAMDSFLPFSLLQLLVPFTSSYRPIWTGLGVAAAEMLLALAITNHYRRRLRYSFWRKAHYLNFAVWALASLHGLLAGTDRGATWLALLYAVAVATIVMLLLWRFGGYVLRSPRVATVGAVTVIALPLLITAGPLYHSPPLWNAKRVSESLTGQVIRNGTNLQQIVSFVGQAGQPQKLLVRADLLVSPQSLESTSLQLEYLPSGDICRGHVTGIGGTSFTGTCRLADGERRSVEASWVLNQQGNGVIGQIRLRG
jgi:methionine sulfoxide reductase heme-binding subunit